jgi:trehalose 6-phosphate synthase/phosphatase
LFVCLGPGGELNDSADRISLTQELSIQHCIPVFLSAHDSELFYNGFCNTILWPLFHYLPLSMESADNHEKLFTAYKRANEEFARIIRNMVKEDDLVWIHDYHLMLLPSLLRSSHPALRLGFFFHTPFPSSELFRILPCRQALLSSILASNLIGFHTHDYSRHFQSSCTRMLGAQGTGDSMKLGGKQAQMGTFPIGIEPNKFIEALKSAKVNSFISDYLTQFSGRKVILGIDRLDYIKGIAHKLIAFERFLTQYPQWIGKCVLVQIAVPSRTDVPDYQKLRSLTHETVGRLNGKFGTVNSIAQPAIIHLDTSIPFEQMTALYHVSDAMLITSVRDGMNLCAYVRTLLSSSIYFNEITHFPLFVCLLYRSM